MPNFLTDSLNRPLHDLRISVIDRCNFRCPYCMPEGTNHKFLNESNWLSFAEIIKLTKIFVDLGTTKIRLTGGEPLLRPNISQLIEQLNQIPNIDLALTTNGSLLKKHAASLKKAGLKRLTVSLDSIDARVFNKMSGEKGALKTVLDGINEANQVGFDSIKINVVIQKNVNDQSIIDLVKYFRNSKHIIRFIEYMDVGNCNHWDMRYVVSSKQIRDLIHTHFPIRALEQNYLGEVAERYEYIDKKGEIGFISSVSQPFCKDCTRARISTDGKLFTCLFASQGIDLKAPMRRNANDEEIKAIIKNTWKKREDRYSELRSNLPIEIKNSKKVEMFQVGG